MGKETMTRAIEESVSFLMKGIGKIIIYVVINEEIIKEIEKE